MKFKVNLVLLSAFFFTSGGFVQAATDSPAGPVGKSALASAQLTAGEVRTVDTEQSKVTIKHEALDNLDMPGMTMVFKVQDEKLLEDVEQGEKIVFRSEKLDAGFTVVTLERAK